LRQAQFATTEKFATRRFSKKLASGQSKKISFNCRPLTRSKCSNFLKNHKNAIQILQMPIIIISKSNIIPLLKIQSFCTKQFFLITTIARNLWPRFYDFSPKILAQIGDWDRKKAVLMDIIHHNISYQEERHVFLQKIVEIAENRIITLSPGVDSCIF
jgi:hypothetical protein